MKKGNELISLSDIKCKKIVDMIEIATEIILYFTTGINQNLKELQLEEPKILIERSSVNTFKNDGNTHNLDINITCFGVLSM